MHDFVCLLVSSMRPSLLISSLELTLHGSRSCTECLLLLCARIFWQVRVVGSVQTMLMRSKFNRYRRPTPCKCAHTPGGILKEPQTWFYHHNTKSPHSPTSPSITHPHLCRITPAIFVPLSFLYNTSPFRSSSSCLSLSATFLTLVLAVQHLPHSHELSLPLLLFPLTFSYVFSAQTLFWLVGGGSGGGSSHSAFLASSSRLPLSSSLTCTHITFCPIFFSVITHLCPFVLHPLPLSSVTHLSAAVTHPSLIWYPFSSFPVLS